jgi:hypothetical protein
MTNDYVPVPPHRIPEEAAKFLATLPEKERALHELAIEILGSSYFVETCHAFVAWQRGQHAPLPPAKAN